MVKSDNQLPQRKRKSHVLSLSENAKKGTKLDDLEDAWGILDDVFVETITDSFGKFKGYKLYGIETKLSDLSPLTSNQAAFQKMLQSGKVDFEIRSVRKEVVDVFKDTKSVTVEKWIQTTGDGLDDAENLITKTLF